jgi:phosphatidylglycerophosphatase A
MASVLAVAAWWFAPLDLAGQLIVGAVLTLAGLWAAGDLERRWGQTDPSAIVIDEVAAMWLVLAGLPHTWPAALVGLAAFRLFDIVKLPPVKRLERLPGGLGVMADDLAAAALARIVVSLFVR